MDMRIKKPKSLHGVQIQLNALPHRGPILIMTCTHSYFFYCALATPQSAQGVLAISTFNNSFVAVSVATYCFASPKLLWLNAKAMAWRSRRLSLDSIRLDINSKARPSINGDTKIQSMGFISRPAAARSYA